MNIIKKYLPLILIASLLAGCAPAAVVRTERFFWPPPPDAPRIEWLEAYNSQLDLKMTPLRKFREFFAGEDAPFSIKKPVEVRVDAKSDKIYVADPDLGGVYIFDVLNGESRMLYTGDSGLPQRITPIGLALDKENCLYVLEPRHGKILVFNSAEKFVRSIDLAKTTSRPVAIAIDKSKGRIYVADIKLNKIFALDLNGTLLFAFGAPGEIEGAFNGPVSIATSSKGDIIIADVFNARIQIFSESGSFKRSFGKRGEGAGDFQLIKSVAVDQDDNIYVVDGRSHAVNIFSQAGETLLTLGGFYSVSKSGKVAPGGFSLPTGIDIDSRGRIYVVDQMNVRIQIFQYFPESLANIR